MRVLQTQQDGPMSISVNYPPPPVAPPSPSAQFASLAQQNAQGNWTSLFRQLPTNPADDRNATAYLYSVLNNTRNARAGVYDKPLWPLGSLPANVLPNPQISLMNEAMWRSQPLPELLFEHRVGLAPEQSFFEAVYNYYVTPQGLTAGQLQARLKAFWKPYPQFTGVGNNINSVNRMTSDFLRRSGQLS
jgi:hypothetical protein